jgi:flagellar hook protein FlgE
MSILTSLFTGASGLAAHGDAIGVVGDNIANASTVGFRSSRASFEDVLGGSARSTQRLGVGVRMTGPETQWNAGSLQQTGNSLDLAIRGGGFFAVSGNHQGVTNTYYTRDGRFHKDDQNYLVNGGGLRLQGYTIDPTGQLSSAPGDLQLGGTSSQPNPTTGVTVAVNLDASETVPPTWNDATPAQTSNFSTSTTVFDSLGEAHRADMYFRKSGTGAWEWYAMVDSGDLGGTPGTPTRIANGTLGFTADGRLDTETTASSSASFANATPNQVINFDFGDSLTTDSGTGLSGSTQFAKASDVGGIDQDGYGAGTLTDVAISEDGTITGQFSNGQSRDIARVALAHFASDDGLRRTGAQLFEATSASGEASLGAAATGGTGWIAAQAIEGSNVDLGQELVTLIAYQRAFQANARTVSTADEMLSEISNLKR